MSYKVLYRKYRPKSFIDLVGQDSIKDVLVNSIKSNRIAHAYIFTGPRGTGKTSTAKIFAKTLNCLNNANGISCDECDMCKTYNESADIIEIDAASNNGVEEIRNLRESVKVAPYNSKFKIYIIDEVHMLSNSAWNAFLKTLEEPPSHVIFILATTEINKIPETVMSRCQRFDFSKISKDDMFLHLTNICKEEKIDINNDALLEIIKMSNGCLRDALSDLDKISKTSQIITLDLIESNFGVMSKKKLEDLYKFVTISDIVKINECLNNIINSGITPINFSNEFVDFLLNKIVNNEFNDLNEMHFIKDMIFKINSLVSNFNSFVNPYILLKTELLTNYFPEKNNVNISREIFDEKEKDILIKQKSDEKTNNIDSSNIVSNNVNQYYLEKIKCIRINNSFVDASKENKNKFKNLWKKFIDSLLLENNYNLLGYIENINIEVVSSTNVLFSLPVLSDAILFNSNLNLIEESFSRLVDCKYNFIALSLEEWESEKKNFINNKNKKYEYIKEVEIEENKQQLIKNKEIAEDIFGNDLIEIR